MDSVAKEASKPGRAMRGRSFSGYLVQRTALSAPSAKRDAASTAFGVQLGIPQR